MKLKFELVNGYGVLVDESREPNLNEWYVNLYTTPTSRTAQRHIHIRHLKNHKKDYRFKYCKPIIFSEPELNLEGVPVFEWRDFEVWQKSKEVKHWGQFASTAFVKGYKSNPAKYTEEDLRKAISMARDYSADVVGYQKDEIIQSLQKYPKYVVMETEIVDFAAPDRIDYDYKLFTNSDGKKQGTVKQLIWE